METKETIQQELQEKEQKSREIHAKSLKWSNFERPYSYIRFVANGVLMVGAIFGWVIYIWYEVLGTHPEWAPWALPVAIAFTVVFLAEKVFHIWMKGHIADLHDDADQIDAEIEELRRKA